MKKVREVTLSGFLDNIKSDITIYEKLLNDLPLKKKFTARTLQDYYKISKNVVYPALTRLESHGIITKSVCYFNGRNNVTVYERIK